MAHQAKFHLHRAEDGEFYMLLIGKNGKVVWQTPGTYKRRAGAINALSFLYMALTDIGPIGGKFPFVDHTTDK